MCHSIIYYAINIIIFGYPTAGKSTQAVILAERYGIEHTSFWENIEKKTPLGIEIDKLMRVGNLVPDKTTDQIVFNKLDEIGEQWLSSSS